MLHSLRRRVDRFTPTQVFLVVLLPLVGLYLGTMTSDLPYHIDAFTNTLTAWDIAAHGSIYLDESPDLASPENFANTGWFTTTPSGHIVSQYPPGTALLAVPFYLADHESHRMPMYGSNNPDAPPVVIDVPSLVPASAAASLATALAVALLALVFLQFISPSEAIVAAYVVGLGTGAWSVASTALWQHGPAMLWIALALFLVSRDHHTGGSLALGLAVFTRPHVALIAAALGVAVAVVKRSVRPLFEIGTGSLLGLLAVIGYNWAVFGSPSISGGYGAAFAEQAAHSSLTWYLRNVADAFFDPRRGLLIWAPFLIMLLPGLARAWKAAPGWVRGAAIGGLLYLLLQLKANRFSGGSGFFAYRYPLEALTAWAPLLVLSWRGWTSRRRFRFVLFVAASLVSIVAQAYGAIRF